jgi:hypothetical protein
MIAEMHRGQEHPLPGLESSKIIADGRDLARDVAAQNVREVYSRKSFAHPDIEMVQGAGFDPDQNLVLAGLWVGDVFVAKNLWTAEFVDANGFHMFLRSLEVIPQITCHAERGETSLSSQSFVSGVGIPRCARNDISRSMTFRT